jgi:hypothetical protein
VLVPSPPTLELLWYSKGEVTVSHVPPFGLLLSRFDAVLDRCGRAQTIRGGIFAEPRESCGSEGRRKRGRKGVDIAKQGMLYRYEDKMKECRYTPRNCNCTCTLAVVMYTPDVPQTLHRTPAHATNLFIAPSRASAPPTRVTDQSAVRPLLVQPSVSSHQRADPQPGTLLVIALCSPYRT